MEEISQEKYLETIKQFKEDNKEENKKIRKVFTEILRHRGKLINWKESEKMHIYFIYEDIEGWIEIKEYIKGRHPRLKLKYIENEFTMGVGDFKNGRIGNILGKITSDFKIEVGTHYKDEKRDITITDREYRIRYDKNIWKHNEKWYKYTCGICGWTEGWILESFLEGQDKVGCSCCSGHNAVEGINSIVDTNPEMIPYFQGGYDEAKLYTRCGGGNPDNRCGRINAVCPDCGRVKSKKINIYNIYNYKSIFCSCSDSIPYTEKAMFSILEQLDIDFQTQLSKTTFDWIINDYKYDFYFEYNREEYIIETHGEQHYKNSFSRIKGARTIEEEVENDRLKKELALKNGIKEENYIVVDCRRSELEFIKNSILTNEKMNKLFNLNNINWSKVEEFALSNLVKMACEYWSNDQKLSANEIGKLMKLNKSTICDYLNKGTKIWDWCNYEGKDEMRKSAIKSSKLTRKPVEIFKDDVRLGVFESVSELDRKSEELFGTKLDFRKISVVCLGKRKSHKGYTFKFV